MFHTQQPTKIQQDSNNSQDKYNNNIIIRNTDPGVPISQEDGEEIARLYKDCIGTYINGSVAAYIESCLRNSPLTVQDVKDAIEITGWAPQPSARYLRAVLRDWWMQGRHESAARHAANRDSGRPWWSKPADDYPFDAPF